MHLVVYHEPGEAENVPKVLEAWLLEGFVYVVIHIFMYEQVYTIYIDIHF